MRQNLILGLLLLMTLSSCKKDEVDQRAVDEKVIQDYIAQRGLETTMTTSGLHYILESEGTGSYPTIDSTVTVVYTGKLPNGGVFDQSPNEGATFPLTSVILGWQEGIPLFREGGSGLLLIPSHLGYGSQARSGIPANSVLIFEIDLLNVE